MHLSSAAEIIKGQLKGDDQLFAGVSIDSRSLCDGDLFVAIPGDHHDGHKYVPMALDRGASGAVVERLVDVQISQLLVKDTTQALGDLGQSWRNNFDIPVLGITGSNGKTTVTEMVRQILSVSNNPVAPKESFNNQWGVPLTLLKLKQEHTHAVIEMGMNHLGEIDYLSRLVNPTAALINNAAEAHLEGLGSVEQVAAAKAEIINGLKDNGVVVLNANDAFFSFWQEAAGKHQVVSFGIDVAADITAKNLSLAPDHSRFQLALEDQVIDISLPMPGLHNIANALGAAALTFSAGISLNDICQGLSRVSAVEGRLQCSTSPRGATVVDDSFNANPASIAEAIRVLVRYPGKKILVLGAMAELGKNGRALHQRVGNIAKKAGIDRMVVLTDTENPDISGYLDGYGVTAESYEDVDQLIDALDGDNHRDTVILVKGSKSSRMGRVVRRLNEQNNNKVEIC